MNKLKTKRRKTKATEMIVCSQCSIAKPETEEHFYFRSNGKRDSRKCRPCTSALKNGNNRQVRDRVLEAYGWACVCCNEDRYEFLQIDHTQGNGAEHRRQVVAHRKSKGSGGLASLRDVIKRGFPDGFVQTMCANCNRAKGTMPGRSCPVHDPASFPQVTLREQRERNRTIDQAHRRVA